MIDSFAVFAYSAPTRFFVQEGVGKFLVYESGLAHEGVFNPRNGIPCVGQIWKVGPEG